MKLQLLVSLDCLHLENALFYAEQAISAGLDILEISSNLLNKTGLHNIQIFRDKFADTFLLADVKMICATQQEMKTIVDFGANAITVCGATDFENWQQVLSIAQEHNLQVFLDFRGFATAIIEQQMPLIQTADYILLGFGSAPKSMLSLLAEIASHSKTSIAASNLEDLDTIADFVTLRVNIIALKYGDGNRKDIKEVILKYRNHLEQVSQDIPDISPRMYSEQMLIHKLQQVSPGTICELSNMPVFLDKVYPLHRFTKIVGRVVTLKVWPGAQLAVLDFLLEVPENSIVVVDSGGDASCAIWNALATEIAMKRNLLGVVIYGAITDVNAIRSKGFPCYIHSLTTVPGHAQPQAQKNVTVAIGNVSINSGDWIMGDDSGAICIPDKNIFGIVEKALELGEYREQVLQKIEQTTDTTELSELINDHHNSYLRHLP